jgi:hypothetical protein
MPLISKTITGMYGGVSQQPAALRIDNQCEEMVNCVPTLVDGVYKRPPTEFVEVLTASDVSSAKVHFIDRDAAEKYAVVFTGDATNPIEVFSLLDGTNKVVGYQDNDARDYAVDLNTRANIKALTIADSTIVVNSMKTPAMTGTAGGTWYPFAIANVLHGVASTDYKVYINGDLAGAYTTGATTSPDTYKTSNIASELYDDIIDWIATQDSPIDWQVVFGGSSIMLFNSNGDDFTFKVEDSWGNAALVGIKEQAPKLEDLPNRMPDSAGFSTDVFSGGQANEYWWNVLLVEDLTQPSGYRMLGDSKMNNVAYAQAMDYWEQLCTKILVDPDLVVEPLAVQILDAPEVGDQWYSEDWTVYRDSTYKLSAWRTDGVRTRLYHGICHREGSGGALEALVVGDQMWNGSAWVPRSGYGQQFSGDHHISVSRHDVVDFTNMAVKIYGEGTKTDFIGYYLRWKEATASGMNATGTWVETVAGGLYNDIDATTMPHKLIRNGDGTFTLSRIDWASRTVGDMDSAPNPSFIGNPINDVYFHKNRVGFLAAGNVIISKSDDYWDFFPTTALEVLDDDPIDITIPSTGVDALRWALPNKGDLLIFGPSDEYMLTSGDQIFSAKSASMDANTNFPISALAAPVRCGANVYFVSPKGDFAAFHEYFTQPQTLTDDAANVAAHCPQYLPAGISCVVPSPTFNLLLSCTGDDTTIYGYKYYWAGEQKAQSAWFKWTFDFYVKAITIIDNYVYIIADNGTETSLEKINLERATETGFNFLVHLDHKTYHTDVTNYDSVDNWSTWDLGHTFVNELLIGDWCLVDLTTGKEIIGLVYVDATQVKVRGDYQGYSVVIGEKYTQSFTFSEFGVPAPKGNVYTPQGRLQLRTLMVSFLDTMMFDLVVTPTGTVEGGRVPITHQYTGVELGLATLGAVTLASKRQRFIVWANAVGVTLTLQNSSFYPAVWYEASWEGYYTSRNQGI